MAGTDSHVSSLRRPDISSSPTVSVSPQVTFNTSSSDATMPESTSA